MFIYFSTYLQSKFIFQESVGREDPSNGSLSIAWLG